MKTRPKTIAEMEARLQNFITPQGMQYALAFRPRPTDVIIATYAKAGTTWMQQIVHGLRTKGDMDFREITEVTPWIEQAHDCGWDLAAEHRADPRAFKSHWDGDEVPPGGRYITVMRDPRDTMVSFHNFFDGWIFEKGAVRLDEFTDWVIDRGLPYSNYWRHLMSWWRRRDEPEVLMLAFEDMKEDLPTSVRRVAEFIGLGEDEEAIEIATRQATFDFMKAHEHQFDDNVIVEKRNPALGLPDDASSSKVKTGNVGGHEEALSPRIRARLEEKWAELVAPETGCRDYDALREALRLGWLGWGRTNSTF